MKITIDSTSESIGTIVLEDHREDSYTITVTNGRFGEFAKEITMVVSKADIKRLAKAS